MNLLLPLSEAKGSRHVPDQVRHCVRSVVLQGKSTSDAWNICRARLTDLKYLKGPHKDDAKAGPKSMEQTRKGEKASRRHSLERDAHKKNVEFKNLFKRMRQR